MRLGEAITKRILDLCKDRDISTNKLCTISGVTQSTVNNIISGRNGSTTVSTIKKLCDGLKLPWESFSPQKILTDWTKKSVDWGEAPYWHEIKSVTVWVGS